MNLLNLLVKNKTRIIFLTNLKLYIWYGTDFRLVLCLNVKLRGFLCGTNQGYKITIDH